MSNVNHPPDICLEVFQHMFINNASQPVHYQLVCASVSLFSLVHYSYSGLPLNYS